MSINKITGVSNVPNLRFPEFAGEWNGTTLNKVSRTIKERVGDKKYALISISTGVGLVSQVEKFGREIAGDSYRNYIVIHKEDFAYNKSATKIYPEGQIAMLISPERGAVPNSIFTCFRVDKEVILPYFLKYLFETNAHGKWLRRFISIGARAHGSLNVDNKDLFSLPIVCPSLTEQTKISALFQFLDDRIATQSQIIKELESLIKGIANVLFDDKRNSFNQLPLSALCQIKKGEQINGLRLSADGDYYVMNGGIVPSGYHTEYNSNADTISISEGGNSCGYVQYNSSRFWSGGHCYTLNDIHPKVSNKYLYYYLKKQEKKIMELRVGSGLPNIQKKELDRFEVKYPPLKKQHEIVRILDSLSDKTGTERNLYSAYQKQKKYLLANMFI